MDEALAGSELVVLAAPSHALRAVTAQAAPHLPGKVPLVTVTKGIENDTLLLMTEVMAEVLPAALHPYLAVLSGPSFAREVAVKHPTAVTLAASDLKVAERCQELFQTDWFRTYTSTDAVGVQLGGALKNVIAIATGLAEGMGLGHNARAALITRGLAEIARIAQKRGANPLTLAGLSGMGDLVLTCTGELSRNRRVGLELGQGKPLKDILAAHKQVAEGVRTARSAKDLGTRYGVELPICAQVHGILHEGQSARAAVAELMLRQPKPEL
jgi:glycerol-3-phosphate dehydrogenase (NAD(P)+)